MNNKCDAIFTRRSVRKFDPSKPVSKDAILELLDAAMHAPTAFDKQPWEFLVISEKSAGEKIRKAHPYCDFLAEAKSAILVCGNTDTAAKSSDGVSYCAYDCSCAAQNIMLRAKQLGLGTCWCAVSPEKTLETSVREAFGIPKNITPIALIVVGTPAECPQLQKPRFDGNKIHWQNW